MHPAVNRMVAPGQKRPRIMRGGIIQIQITRACDKACHHCTQGSNLAGKPAMMTVEEFDAACASLEGYQGVVGVDRKSTRLNSSHLKLSRMPSSA